MRRWASASVTPDVHVGVDGGVAAGPHLLDRPGDVAGRQVVEQHAVGELAGEAQHAGVEGAQHDLRAALAEAHPEAEPLDPEEVAVEVDLLAAEAGPQQGEVLAHPGERPVGAVLGTVPARHHGGRGGPDPEQHVDVGVQGLEGGGAHRGERRRAQRRGQHAGAEAEARLGGAHRGEGGERLGADGLGDPERAVAQVCGPARRGEPGVGAEGGEAGEGDPEVGGRCHGDRRYRRGPGLTTSPCG